MPRFQIRNPSKLVVLSFDNGEELVEAVFTSSVQVEDLLWHPESCLSLLAVVITLSSEAVPHAVILTKRWSCQSGLSLSYYHSVAILRSTQRRFPHSLPFRYPGEPPFASTPLPFGIPLRSHPFGHNRLSMMQMIFNRHVLKEAEKKSSFSQRR